MAKGDTCVTRRQLTTFRGSEVRRVVITGLGVIAATGKDTDTFFTNRH